MGMVWLVGVTLWAVGLLLVWALLYGLGEQESGQRTGP